MSAFRATSRPGPQPSELEGQLAVVPDRQQVHQVALCGHRVQDQVVAVQVLAQTVGCAGRQCGQLRERFCGLRRLVEIAPPDAGEAPEVGDDGRAQLGEQPVVGGPSVRLGQEGLGRPPCRAECPKAAGLSMAL